MALALLWTAGGCSDGPKDEYAERPAGGTGSPPISLVVLISLDTLRADHLGIYGYDRRTSPRIDAMARRGVRFLDASSTSTWTLPAHASLLTGRYVDGHGLRDENRGLPGRVITLAASLRKAGWRTGCAVNSFYLSRRFGLQRGFELDLWVEESADRIAPSSWITDQALAWIDEAAEEPLFLFLHYYDIHSDYGALPEHRRLFERPYAGSRDGTTSQLVSIQEGQATLAPADALHLVDLYDASIHQTDAELGRLFDAIEQRGLSERTLLVLTSDHGEEFLEHGGVLHGRSQYQEQLRVPLILVGPGLPANLALDVPVSLVDVAPTLLDLLAVEHPAPLDGESLRPLLGGARPVSLVDRVLFSESRHGIDDPVETWAARLGSLKQIRGADGATQIFDLSTDPRELGGRPGADPERARRLSAALESFRDRVEQRTMGRSSPLSPEERAHLRALGYLADEPSDSTP